MFFYAIRRTTAADRKGEGWYYVTFGEDYNTYTRSFCGDNYKNFPSIEAAKAMLPDGLYWVKELEYDKPHVDVVCIGIAVCDGR